MTFKQFIRDNRAELDAAIHGALTQHLCECNRCRGDHGQFGFCPNGSGQFRQAKDTSTLNDAERRLWILNDEGLYRWARSEGVRL